MARMGRYMGIETVVYVPADVHFTTRELIREEGAEVVVAQGGGYDGTVEETRGRAEREGEGGLLVMDIAWEGYEDVPKVCGPSGQGQKWVSLTFGSGLWRDIRRCWTRWTARSLLPPAGDLRRMQLFLLGAARSHRP